MIFSTPIQEKRLNFQGLNKFKYCTRLSSFIEICLLVGLQVRFLDFFKFLWFSRLLFKIDGWNFQGLNKFTFYIFPQSFKICSLIGVLDQFLDFLAINLKRFKWFIFDDIVHFFRIFLITFVKSSFVSNCLPSATYVLHTKLKNKKTRRQEIDKLI